MTTTSQSSRYSRRTALLLGGAAVGAATLGTIYHGARAIGASPPSRSQREQSPLTTVRRWTMGAELELTLPAAASAALAAGLVELRLVESALSAFDPRSELSRVNARAASAPQSLSPMLAEVLAASRRMHAASEGAFDPTVGPLLEAWGFRGERARPAPGLVREARERVGFDRLALDDRSVSFRREGVALDLGGIAVGYGLDRAATALARRGVRAALLNAGGDVRALGAPPDAGSWRVGVKHPDRARELLAVVELAADRALTTSGTYAKQLVVGGRRISHIFDPRTGDSPGEVLSATVVASTALEADALATACVVLGGDEALALLGRAGAEGLLVVERAGRRRVEGTAGLRAQIVRQV
jgi:thiamine biosynthesis lipoprotein